MEKETRLAERLRVESTNKMAALDRLRNAASDYYDSRTKFLSASWVYIVSAALSDIALELKVEINGGQQERANEEFMKAAPTASADSRKVHNAVRFCAIVFNHDAPFDRDVILTEPVNDEYYKTLSRYIKEAKAIMQPVVERAVKNEAAGKSVPAMWPALKEMGPLAQKFLNERLGADRETEENSPSLLRPAPFGFVRSPRHNPDSPSLQFSNVCHFRPSHSQIPYYGSRPRSAPVKGNSGFLWAFQYSLT